MIAPRGSPGGCCTMVIRPSVRESFSPGCCKSGICLVEGASLCYAVACGQAGGFGLPLSPWFLSCFSGCGSVTVACCGGVCRDACVDVDVAAARARSGWLCAGTAGERGRSRRYETLPAQVPGEVRT